MFNDINNTSTNVSTDSSDGDTDLHLAVKSENSGRKIFTLLLNPDIDVNKQNNAGETALHIAATNDNMQAVMELLNHPHIDINKQNNNHEIVLHVAAMNGHSNIVDKLLQHVNINKQNNYQRILHVAAMNGHVDVVFELLQNHNVNVNQQNQDGNTAFRIAEMYEHENVMHLLRSHQRQKSMRVLMLCYKTDTNKKKQHYSLIYQLICCNMAQKNLLRRKKKTW